MNRKCLLAASLSVAWPVIASMAETPRNVSVGVMAELSGPFSSIGDECRRGYDVAAKSLTENGRVGHYNVKVIYGDHQREPKVGITEFNRFLGQDEVLAVVSNASSVVMALNPISQAKKIPFFGVSAHPKFVEGNPYAFRFWLNANVEGGGIADRAILLNKKAIAILTLEDDYPLAVSEGFRTRYRSHGDLVFDERILKTEADFSAIATRVRRANPDAIFVNVVGDQLPLVIRKFREQGLKQQIFSTFSMARKDYLSSAGLDNVEGIIFLEVDGEKPKFTERMKEMFGTTLPTGLNYTCYAALGFFIESLKHNPAIETSEDLYKTLLEIHPVNLLDGPLQIKQREAQLEYVLRIIKNGQVADLT